MVKSKSGLAIELSRLKVFEKPSGVLEQYPTESEFAAEILWFASMRNEISGKVIADLGCGTGILGIGCLLLGASKVIFVDIDEKALELTKENLISIDKKLLDKAVFINKYVKLVDKKVDLVFQNPPFGTRKKGIDIAFLEKAMEIADVVYSFHKAETKAFIDEKIRKNGFETTNYWVFDWPLKMAMKHHRKRIQYIKVGCWCLEKPFASKTLGKNN